MWPSISLKLMEEIRSVWRKLQMFLVTVNLLYIFGWGTVKIEMIRHCVKSVCIRSYSDPHFSVFWLNTEKYSVSFCIQSKYGKIRNKITPNTDTFNAVRVKVQFVEWISRDGQIKNFFYMRRGRKLVVGKMHRSIK